MRGRLRHLSAHVDPLGMLIGEWGEAAMPAAAS